MTAKLKKDRIEQILHSLKEAAAGDYSQKLDFASKDDELGQIADAVNKLLKKSARKLSDSRQTTTELSEDAHRYRHILDNIEESYFEVDLQGNLFFVNDTAVRDLGYSQEELRGIHFSKLVDEANAKKVYEAFHQVFLTDRPIKGFDWEILKKNKEKIDVESSVALLHDETGKPVGFRGVVRNISERVQAQNDLRQSEEKYRTILDIMDEGYLEQDLAGRITFANDAACRSMRYGRDQLIGVSYRDYLTTEVAGKMKEIFQKIYSTGKPARLVDYDLVRRDGSVVTYELNGALRYDSSGKPCGFCVLLRDVSLRKRAEEAKRLSEEKYRIILEIMGEGYFETDSRGAITFVNDAGCNLAERGREELISTNHNPYSTPESMNRINEAYRSIYRGDAAKMTLDYNVIRKDGSVGTHQQNVALLHDEAGRPKGFRVLVRDVTERKKAEDALRESEEKYRTILEDMDEIYLETDLGGNFIFFNDSFCRVLGYSRAELQNANYRLIIPPGQTRNLFEMFNEIYRTGQKKTFVNHEIIIKDGSTIYLEMSVSLKRSPTGEPIGFSGISRDVTPRIKAERVIQDREKRLRLITENIRDIIWTMDFNLRWTYLSPSVLQMTGFSPAEVMGMPLKAMLPTETFALIEHSLAEELAKEARGLAPGEQRKTTFEMPLLHKNGTRLWVEISADFSRDENGKPLEIIGVTRDISERKKVREALEEREAIYRKTLESTSDGVSIVQNGRYVYYNEQFLGTLGIPKGYPIGGEPLASLIHPDDREMIRDSYKRRLEGKPTDGKHEVRVVRPDGKLLYLLVTSVNTVYNGQPAILNFMQNITERKNAENALKESEKRYRMMTENVNDIVWIINFDLQITYVSPSNIRLTGYTPDEVQNKPLDNFVAPDSLTLAARALCDELARETDGQPVDLNRSTTIQIEVYSKNGENIWLEVNATFNRDTEGKATEILAVGRNITQRRNMEKALAESEQRYRMIVENMHDSISIVDLNLQYVYQSPSEIWVTGYTPEEIMAIPLQDQLTPESYALAHEVLARELLLESGDEPVDPDRSINLEMEAFHKNGTKIWQEMNAVFQRDRNGKPVGIILTSRDITARKRAELALAESEKRYRIMAETINDIIWTINLDLQITYVSPSCTRVTGYSQEETHRTPLDQLLTAESFARATGRLADELALEASGQPFSPNRAITIEVEANHKEGGLIWLEITGTFNRNQCGEITEILVVGRDITERKRAEQALEDSEKLYRMIVENMQDVIWIMDFNLQYKYRSPSSMRITGYTADEIMSVPPSKQMTPESYVLAQSILLEELEREQSGLPIDPHRARTMELEVYKKGGGTSWIDVTATFNRDREGKPFEILLAARDISVRKRMENALRESEQRYRMIVENMHGSIALLDLNFEYLYLSPSEIRVTGYRPEEIMKIPLKDQMTPQSYALAEKIFAEELELEASGAPINPHRSRTMELEVHHKYGDTVWEELTAAFTRDENGQPTGLMITTRDVTERRKVQEDLKQSEQRYRMIVENMQDVIGIMDFNFQFTYVSNDNIQLTGYTKEEVKDVPIDKLLTPGSLSLISDIFAEEMEREKKRTIFNDPVMRTLELELFHKAGGTTWAEVTATLTRDQYGKPKEILLVARDITARRKIQEALKESEQRYRMIIETMQEVIWTTDLNLQNTYMSPSCFLLTGYTPDELMVLPLDQLLTPESLTTATNVVMEELARETGAQIVFEPYRSRTMEQEIRCKNGDTIWIEVTGTFIRNVKGNATGMLMAGRDITASKKSREERYKLEAQLMQAQKMEIVGRLAGGVAHDFNNMLSVILGYVDLAKLRLAKQHPVLNDIAEIEKAAIRSRDITTQLLAFSRKQIIEPKIIDLNDLVAHTQKALIRLIGEDVGLHVALGENLWPIKFDPSQIEQILINLAVNARDAMPDGGRLTIETVNTVLDDSYCEKNIDFVPGHYVRLSFSDNGVGMDKETLQHIFEPFFTTKDVGKGTGLGLATVYGIVKQNNGFVNVYSEPAHGTTFSIYLPRAEEESDHPIEPEEDVQITGTGNILLVEDDAMVLQITRGILESIGYTVKSADKPADAVAYCKNPDACIDLVITDVVMPGISGKELRNKLVEIRPDINVIFMSGYTADVIAQHGVLEDGVQFIQKPFTIKSLAAKVAEALAAKKQA